MHKESIFIMGYMFDEAMFSVGLSTWFKGKGVLK